MDPEAPRRTVLRMKRYESHETDEDDVKDDRKSEFDDGGWEKEDNEHGRGQRQRHYGDDASSQRSRENGEHSLPGYSAVRKSAGRNGAHAAGPITASKDTPLAGVSGGSMIWIDISSWQTAGCWVPGGVNGACPYQAADNTVALQEIIKVSLIGK